MRQPSVLTEGRTRFADGGPIRRVHVRAHGSDADADTLLPLAMVMAGLVGMVMGVVGANPSLVSGWLS